MKYPRLLPILFSVLPVTQGLVNTGADLQTLALDIPVPLSTEDPAPGAEVAKTRFTKSVWGGNGCPVRDSSDDARTLEFSVGRDGTLGYNFTDLYAYIGPAWGDGGGGEQQQPAASTECMVLVSIGDIEPGWSFRITGGTARGYYSRAPGSSLQIDFSIDFANDNDGDEIPNLYGYTGIGIEPTAGSFAREFMTINDDNRRAVETPCVPDETSLAMLNLTMSVTATSETSPAEWGILQLEGVDLEGYLWPCDV